MIGLANPKRFYDASGRLLPWLIAAAILALVAGLWFAATVPPDYRQGEAVRIMFVHVPAAWVAMLAYASMALAAVIVLVARLPLAEVALQTAAPLGALFTALGLVTGALWGRPMWGVYWVWDGRLTSFLVLLFLYLGVIALAGAIDDQRRAARAAAVLAVVGAVNLPIIHFSVVWWSTLHQGASLLKAGGKGLAPVYLAPLLAMALAYTLLFFALWLVRIRTEILSRRRTGEGSGR